MSDGWGTESTPDWTALAEQHEQEQTRRKRLRMAAAVAGAVLAVGGITVTAVALGSHGRNGDGGTDRLAIDTTPTAPEATATGPAPDASAAAPSGSGSPSGSASASAAASKSARPSASGTAATTGPAGPPSPADPLTVISSVTTDTAPLTPATLFPAATLTVDGKTWTRLVDATNTTCWQATTGGLGDVLAPQGCRAMLRVTYVSGTSAVTVGVAVMDTRAQADAAEAGYKGQVQGLVKAGSTSYCTSPGCAATHSAIGRYTVYTVAGTTKGGTTADPVATAAGPDLAAYTRNQLLARGKR